MTGWAESELDRVAQAFWYKLGSRSFRGGADDDLGVQESVER